MTSKRDARQKLFLVALAFGTGILVSIVCAAVASTRGVTPGSFVAVAVLGTLAAVATYLDVDVETAIGLSGNTMILTAAMVVFRSDQFYLGVALVAVLGALDLIRFASMSTTRW
jgi:hypothetical protein